MITFEDVKNRKYIEGVGRRKETTARVRIYQLNKDEKPFFIINNKDASKYFDEFDLQYILYPFHVVNLQGKFGISVWIKGGGMTGWKDAIRLGLARALVKHDQNLKPALRKEGLLTRDARVVERKKVGLKKARKAPRWRKR